jgi:hypothetical protein
MENHAGIAHAPTVVVELATGALGALATTSSGELAGVVPGCAEASVLLVATCDGEPTGAAAPKPRGGPSVLLAAVHGTRPTEAAAPKRGEPWAPLAAACGARPTRAAAPTPGEVPVKEEEPTSKGTQSISDRKSKEDEGGSEISANGKEASSNVTCHEMMSRCKIKTLIALVF